MNSLSRGTCREPRLCERNPNRAQITDTTCAALDVTAHGNAPVLALCRKLVEAGHDPALPAHAYRGDVLALKVRSIGEGARLRVSPRGVGFVWEPDADEQQPQLLTESTGGAVEAHVAVRAPGTKPQAAPDPRARARDQAAVCL
jgi:hypothetical protein